MGKPYINLLGALKEYCEDNGIVNYNISISHDGGIAISVVYLETDYDKKIYYKCVGKVKTDTEGILTLDKVQGILKKRESNSHKGTYGRVVVVGGSQGLTGAPVMSCQASLKSGAGLITLMCAKSLNVIFETMLKEVMTQPLSDNDGIIDRENKEKSRYQYR